MSKKVIHGNTKAGGDYSFEFKKRTTDNTKMYHVAIYRQFSTHVGGRQIFDESKQIKLYTPKDYDLRFDAKVIRTGNGKNRVLGNADWLSSLARKDGGIGYELLFDPTLYTEEITTEKAHSEPKEFEFTSKSQVTQANSQMLLDYCQGHYQLHEFDGLSGVKMKELIIEKLNF